MWTDCQNRNYRYFALWDFEILGKFSITTCSVEVVLSSCAKR
jgi:hypothetical protein